MKTLITLLFASFALVFLTTLAFANSNTQAASESQSIDTLEWYTARTHSAYRKGKNKYWVNGAAVSKETYDKYNVTAEEIMGCTTCYVRHYSTSDKLLWEADQYTDCLVGNYKSYYPSGKVAIQGTYKNDSTGVYDISNPNSWCGIRHGKWTYYNPNGAIDSVVNYSEGKRMEQ